MITSLIGFPSILQNLQSGIWVPEWFPHINQSLILSVETLAFRANCILSLLWSNLLMQEKFSFGIDGAFLDNINQFVFAGLATTKHFTVFFANLSKAYPCSLNIFQLIAMRSFLCWPGFLGKPPMKTPTSISLNIYFQSVPRCTYFSNGKAQSSNSSYNAFNISIITGISSKYIITGWSNPNTYPDATIGVK